MSQQVPLCGELPDAEEDDLVVFIGCDNAFFLEFGIILAFSVQKYSPGVKLHIHVFNPDESFDHIVGVLMVGLRKLSWTITFDHPPYLEDMDDRRIYYANARFVRFSQICHAVSTTYFLLDADSIVRGSLLGLLDLARTNDIVIRRRMREDPAKQLMAGGIVVSPTLRGREFTARIANEIQENISSGAAYWSMDQITISSVFQQMKKEENVLKVGELPLSYLDWNFDDKSQIWTGKGDSKYTDQKFRVIYQELEKDTAINEFSQSFWEEAGSSQGARVLVLAPRINSSFKRANLITPELRAKSTAEEIAELRKFWPEFATQLQQALVLQGANAHILTLDNWRVTPDLVNLLHADAVIIPHRQEFQLTGISARCFYYMQVVTPWLFSFDSKGWGAGVSSYPCISYTSGDPGSPTFDHYRENLVTRNISKFSQPDRMTADKMRADGLIPEGDYIFFPCQIPNDETLLYFSDVDEEVFVKALSMWANENSIHVVFKGHPIKLSSMEPLMAVGTGPFVRWSDASIHDLIENAAAVYTINGGTGFEAMFHDKPIVTFGRVEYDAVTIAGNIRDLDATWRAVQGQDHESMQVEYRRFVDWYCRQFAVDLSLSDEERKERFDRAAHDVLDDLPVIHVESASQASTFPNSAAHEREAQESALSGPSPAPAPGKGGQTTKLGAMFQAFKFLGKSEIEGDYYEFGCFEGTSLIDAYYSAQYTPKIQRQFYAFDSFEGLPPLEDMDQLSDYNMFSEGQYGCSKSAVEQNLINAGIPPGSVNYVEGYYDVSLAHEDTLVLMCNSKAAMIHVDCDLYSSAKDVLEFISGRIVDGAILMFDDWFCYRGRPDRGVARAFHEWKRTVPITFTEYFRYSWAGIAFICSIDVDPEILGDMDDHA